MIRRGARAIAHVAALAVWAMVAMPVVATAQGHGMKPIPIDPGNWITPDDYPPEAIRADRVGRVVVDVGVDSTGRPVTCRTKASSGTAVLDARTCSLILERGRFDPATDAKRRKTASTTTLSFMWQIPDRPADTVVDLDGPKANQKLDFDVGVSDTGVIVSCKAAAGNTIGDDPCARVTIGKQFDFRFEKKGTPVAVVVHVTNALVATAVP